MKNIVNKIKQIYRYLFEYIKSNKNNIKVYLLKNKIKILILIILFLSLFKIIDNFKYTSIKVEKNQNIPVLNKSERKLLKLIYKEMSNDSLENSAKIIIDNEEKIEDLFVKTLKEKVYLFDGKDLLDLEFSKKGKFLLINDISRFYFGDINFLLPNGKGTFINAYKADSNRYSYAKGTWVNGKLNGICESGNAIFGRISGTNDLLFSLKGNFIDDLLDGEVLLTIINEKGIKSNYKFDVKNGVSLINTKTRYNKKDKRYEITSLEDENKKYIIDEKEIQDIKWFNRLRF